jgi:hypothetical protein
MKKYQINYRKLHRKMYRESSLKWRNKNIDKINKKRRELYKTNSQYKKQSIIRRNKWHNRIFAILTNIKLMSGCKICGYKRSSGALVFHHLDKDKKLFSFSIKEIKLSISNKQIIAETKKCIVLCSNCHSEIHSGITKLPK